MKVAKRLNPELSSQGKYIFCCTFLMLCLSEMTDITKYRGPHFMMYVSLITVLHTLSFSSAVNQL